MNEANVIINRSTDSHVRRCNANPDNPACSRCGLCGGNSRKQEAIAKGGSPLSIAGSCRNDGAHGVTRPTLGHPVQHLSLPELEAQLQEGDILFTAAPDFIFRKVARTTGSWTSHVGIAFRDESGWRIAESTVPISRFSSLRGHMRGSESGRFALCRLKTGVSPEQVTALRREAKARMRVPYHFGFDYQSRLQFCSKFVHDVYESALGVHIGRYETFADLLTNNPEAPIAFWRCWFLGNIPWDRVTVTPAAQLRSELLVPVNSGMVMRSRN